MGAEVSLQSELRTKVGEKENKHFWWASFTCLWELHPAISVKSGVPVLLCLSEQCIVVS